MRVELLLREIQGVVYQGATPSTRTTSGLDTRALLACLPACLPASRAPALSVESVP